MTRQHRPHVCSALQHLRTGVFACALVLALCAGIHLLIWAFVHFTDVRWTTAEGPASEPSYVVVEGQAQPATTVVNRTTAQPREGVDPNLVPSVADRSMSLVITLTDAVGVVACIVLVGLTRQTVAIAAGASVPGVNKLVSASSWTLVIALLAIPLAGLISGFPLPGVFSGYEAMIGAHVAVVAGAVGTGAYFATALMLPLAFLAGLGLIVLRYVSGVEEGVIATSVADLDSKLAREISGIKIGSNAAPRAVGALNAAIGADGPDPVEDALGRERGRRIGESSPGQPLGRPI